MRLHARLSTFAVISLLVFATPAIPQSTTYGQLVGVVHDNQGGVLPGAAVTLSGPATLGEPTTATDVDGSYLFRALSPGTYNVRFEIPGFTTLERQGVIITTGTTITINATLELASIEESVTVPGDSPTVDVKTTRLGATFDETKLQDVPSATDIWAALAQSPGIRMRGYDVGGSHKIQGTAYETFGLQGQNRVVIDGIDATLYGSGSGFYQDYYAIQELQVSASGADVEMTSPGASLVTTIKSGGNRLSGLFSIEYENASMVGDNIDEELADRGFTGNPNLLFWEAHAELGGPIAKDKAWFFGAFNYYKLEKARSGVDPEVATDVGIFDSYIGKLTFQASDRDKLIGYLHRATKRQPNKGLGYWRPAESTWDQRGGGPPAFKAEWQRVWSERLFSNIQLKYIGWEINFIPSTDPATHPSRLDGSTGIYSGSAGRAVQTFSQPQASAQVHYYLPSRAGSHDFKLGFEWLRNSIGTRLESPAIFYRDLSQLGRPMNVNEIQFWNYPSDSDDRNAHLDFYVQDIWTVSDRITLSLGARLTRQRAHYQTSELNPIFPDMFATGTRPGRDVVTWLTLAPRLGLVYDVTGEGKTAFKAHYGRYYMNLDYILRYANPNGRALQQYKFLDPNENGLYDGPHELGPLVFKTSEGEGTPVNPDLTPSYADELSFSLEHEVAADTSLRFSYVHKILKNDFGNWNRAQVLPLNEAGIPCGDDVFPCPLDPFTGESINVARVPDQAAGQQDVLIDTYPDPDMHWDTLQFIANRRFRGNFFVRGSFDYQWRNELRSVSDNRIPGFADPLRQEFFQNHSLDVANRQKFTNWGARILARYVFPHEVALSANIRHQSGWPWAPIHRVPIPGSGTQAVFLEDINNNRSDNVTLVDVRFEKAVNVSGRHRFTAMTDVYNLLNSNAVTNMILRTGRSFGTVIEALAPRTVTVGLRWQF